MPFSQIFNRRLYGLTNKIIKDEAQLGDNWLWEAVALGKSDWVVKKDDSNRE